MVDLGFGKLATNVSSTLLRQTVAGVLQLITIAIIARVYGPAGNGAYAVVLLLPSMLTTFLNLGIGPANVYFLGSVQFSPREVLISCIKFTVILSVIGVAIGGSIIQLKSEVIFPGIEPLMLWLALASFPISLMQSFIISIFQGMQKFTEFNIILLATPLITLVVVSVLIVSGHTNLTTLIIAYIMGIIVTLLISIILLQKYLKVDDEKLGENYTKSAINYGYKAHLSNIMAFVNYKVDIFLVNFFLNPASAGVYVIAVQLSERL